MTIAYLRVSTGKQHLENQKEEIEKFAARKNLTVNRWVTEVVSGKKKEHDRKLGRLLKSLKKGRCINRYGIIPIKSNIARHNVNSSSLS